MLTSEGIPDVLESYRLLREKMNDFPLRKIPQLVIAGHSAVDDPDGTAVYDQTLKMITSSDYDTIASDIIVMRVGPSDQILNVLLSNAIIVLQLSLREGFEVKVSEALHKGQPVIAYKSGGIPLQIKNGKSGFLVTTGDKETVADHLYDLITDKELYIDICSSAKNSVSDEVGTVGNAISWLYMFNELARGKDLKPNGQWIFDMMRKELNYPVQAGENLLPRNLGN